MNIQSWMIKSWARLEWYLPLQTEMLPRFDPVSTQIRDDGSTTGLRAGDTVWVADVDDGLAGLAWEWLEVQPGVVMLADPNSIITNLQIVDSQHSQVSRLAKTIAVNRMVYALPWQTSVCAHLQRAVAGAALPLPALAQPPLPNAPARAMHAAETAFGAPLPTPPALRSPTTTMARHPSHSTHRRLAVETSVRPHSRASDHEPLFERRGTGDWRRAA